MSSSRSRRVTLDRPADGPRRCGHSVVWLSHRLAKPITRVQIPVPAPPSNSSSEVAGGPRPGPSRSAGLTVLRLGGAIRLPARQDRSARPLDRKETPHPRRIHPEQEELPSRSLGTLERRAPALHPDSTEAGRDFGRGHGMHQSPATIGGLEGKVLPGSRLGRAKAPPNDGLEESLSRYRAVARELDELGRPVTRVGPAFVVPFHAPTLPLRSVALPHPADDPVAREGERNSVVGRCRPVGLASRRSLGCVPRHPRLNSRKATRRFWAGDATADRWRV
jgi:hypothetical protein